MSDAQSGEPTRQTELKFHVSPDLDYTYRDFANIYVGAGDVLLELGNYHRAMPGHATVGNRIVLSIATAYELQQKLHQALTEAQRQLQEQLREKSKGKS